MNKKIKEFIGRPKDILLVTLFIIILAMPYVVYYYTDHSTSLLIDPIQKATCYIDDDGEYHYIIKTKYTGLHKANDVEEGENGLVISDKNCIKTETYNLNSMIKRYTVYLPIDSIKLKVYN